MVRLGSVEAVAVAERQSSVVEPGDGPDGEGARARVELDSDRMSNDGHTLPRTVFLVHYLQGFPEKGDYEKPARVEARQSLFYDARACGFFLDALEAWPLFHKVEAVYRIGVPNWEKIDPAADLPRRYPTERPKETT